MINKKVETKKQKQKFKIKEKNKNQESQLLTLKNVNRRNAH